MTMRTLVRCGRRRGGARVIERDRAVPSRVADPAARNAAAANYRRLHARRSATAGAAGADLPHRRRSHHHRRRRRRRPRQPGGGPRRRRVLREDRRRGAPRRVGGAGEGGRRGREETGRRQERDVLHQQPHAAQRPADRHRRRSDAHPPGLGPADHGRGVAVSRSAEPARPGGVHRLPRAGPARQLHQRQAAAAAGDAGAHRPAAARDRRSVQHRRHRGAGDRRSRAISSRSPQVVIRECRCAEPPQRAQCERDIVTESGEIARRLREETPTSR